MTSYLLKITLQKTPNLIWRRFAVPSFITLNRLHEVIQSVMGWENKRQHYYSANKQRFVPSGQFTAEQPAEGRISTAPAGTLPDGLPENAFSLDDIVFRSGCHLKYIYGTAERQWIHLVNVENTRFGSGTCPYPIYCTEGIRACPPESVADAEEFAGIIAAIKNPGKAEYSEICRQYVGFEPDKFDVEAINKKFSVPSDFLLNSTETPPPAASARKPRSRHKQHSDVLHQLGMKLKKAV
ncbi:hypothetical protein FACS189427_08310 [Planctomycetales bacterium]|nr:hypothetical protein FACS189427_08310 [Planctomycetales bacterium]